MDDHPVIGWNQDPSGPDLYRYWNGNEWSGHARASDDGGNGTFIEYGGSCGGWNQRWYRPILRSTVVFHAMAWFDCSVPVTRGHLGRFMHPAEQRSIHQIEKLRNGK